MNNTEAKFILNAYRPSGGDAAEPAMADALAQARNDPALGTWFAREQAHGAAMAAKLREIAPPAGLRVAILTGGRMSRGVSEVPRRRWWAQPAWLAVAAAAALLLAAGAWWRLAPARGDTFENFAVNFVARGFLLSKRSADLSELKSWLSEQHGPLPGALPVRFAELRALGCRKLNYQGRDVSLVCFERGGKEFHVFVAAREDIPGGAEPSPRFIEQGKLAAATWTDANHRFVLVSDAGIAAVRQLL